MFSKIAPLLLVLLMTPMYVVGQGIKTIIIEGVPAIDGNGIFGTQVSVVRTFDKVVSLDTGIGANLPASPS